MKSLFKLTHSNQEGLKIYPAIDSSLHLKQKVPPLNSMRSVTPDSIQRLKDFSSRGITERKFSPLGEQKESQAHLENSTKRVRSSLQQRLKRSLPKENPSKKFIENEEKKVSYKDFQKLHRGYNEIQKKFIMKKFNIKARIQKIMKIVVKPRIQEQAEPEDTFLVNTVYEKPALTFAEKLLRLQQVSIFK